MECRDCKKSIPEYLAGELEDGQTDYLLAHLNICPACRYELEIFRKLDELISSADTEIPAVNLSQDILKMVKADYPYPAKPHAKNRRRTLAVFQDLVAAAAAALILFWFSGPLLDGSSVRMPAEGVVTVSRSVGRAFEAYINLSTTALDTMMNSFSKIGTGLIEGDDVH